MKKILLWLFMFTGLLIGQTIPNAGFENGTISPFVNGSISKLSTARSPVHTGTYSALYSIGWGVTYISTNSITISASTSYTFTIWTYGDGSNRMIVELRKSDGTTVLATKVLPLTGSWIQSTLTFTTDASTTAFQIWLYNPDGGSALYYLDDMAISGGGAPANTSDFFKFFR